MKVKSTFWREHLGGFGGEFVPFKFRPTSGYSTGEPFVPLDFSQLALSSGIFPAISTPMVPNAQPLKLFILQALKPVQKPYVDALGHVLQHLPESDKMYGCIACIITQQIQLIINTYHHHRGGG